MALLPPLATNKPSLTEEERKNLIREEQSSFIVQTLVEDLDLTIFVIKGLLDKVDPKKAAQLLKSGFEMKVAAMMDEHTKLQSDLSAKVADGSMQQSEMLIRIKNSDGKIRSMQWFLSNLG